MKCGPSEAQKTLREARWELKKSKEKQNIAGNGTWQKNAKV
jgi:hypothetical protein